MKSEKIISVCLATILMASMFLISGAAAQVAGPEFPHLNLDSRTAFPGNSTIPEEPEPDRSVTTPLKTGQIGASGALGKYGAIVAYDDVSGTSNNPHPYFYPSLVGSCHKVF